MEGSGALFNYIYGGCGDCSPPPVGTLMSETNFSKVIFGYHIAPRHRFTYFVPQLVFLYPPLLQVRYWNFLILILERDACPYTLNVLTALLAVITKIMLSIYNRILRYNT